MQTRTDCRKSTRPSDIVLRKLEDRILFSGVPAATIDLPPEEMINESFQFDINFDNTASDPADVGYAPYVDLSVPDGIDVDPSSATYLGSPVDMVLAGEFDAAGNLVDPNTGLPVDHPILGTPVTGGTPGESLYVVELPFGSFVPDQPIAQISVQATLDSSDGATVGSPLSMSATGGFALGDDELDNPAVDQPITGPTSTGSITPQVVNLQKRHSASENETATGPGFPLTYQLVIDIADGETIDDIDITDVLPSSFVYIGGSLSVSTAGGVIVNGQSITDQPIAGSPQNAPNNDFLIEFDSITGTTSDEDVVISYQVYVDRVDADGNPVLNPDSGDDSAAVNQSRLDAGYDGNSISDNDASTDSIVELRSLAIQKGVAIVNDVGGSGATPGDTLEYTLEIQVSDFFQFSNVIIDDNFSDGQRFDTAFSPTFVITENGVANSGLFDVANFSTFLNSGAGTNDGSTDVQFNISAEDLDGFLTGDLYADASQGGGTTVTIRYRTVIQDLFSDDFPSGDNSVDVGDILTNDVVVTGTLPSGQTEQDTSGASVEIEGPSVNKVVYAVDGVTTGIDTITSRSTITYRLTMSLPTADVENLVLTDYLPLPIFDATEIPEATGFDVGLAGTVPPAGTATFGPSHTLNTVLGTTLVPTIVTDAAANTVVFDFGSFDAASNSTAVVDILFTVTAQDVVMADGLRLTNQVQASYESTNQGSQISGAIVQIIKAAPELNLSKGVVSTNAISPTYSPSTVGPVAFAAPNSGGAAFAGGITSSNLSTSPVDSNLTGADAGDLVKFALVIENTGGARAFDVLIQDVIPAQYQIPGVGLNLEVRDGDGNLITYTGAASDLFGSGIELNDPGTQTGAINSQTAAEAAGDGSNIILITYDLELTTAVAPNSTYTNNATIAEFGAVDNGVDHTDGVDDSDWTDGADVTTRGFSSIKTVVATSEAHTGFVSGFERVTIGEIVRYRLAVEIPEGTITNLQIRDLLPSGLQFIDDGSSTVAFVSNGAGISSADLAGTLDVSVGAGANINGNAATTPVFVLSDHNVGSTGSGNSDNDTYTSGHDPYFKLGTIVNADNDADAEYVVIEFNALVLNAAAASNDQNDIRTNRFQVRVDGGIEDTSNDALVRIAEPLINNLNKTVSPTAGDAGDTVTYTITFRNSSSGNRSTAFDVNLVDLVPSDLTLDLASINVNLGGGSTGVTNNSVGNQVDLTIDEIPNGGSVTVTFDATLNTSVQPDELITNTANVTYSSLPGSGTAINPTGSVTPGATGGDTGERDGSGGHNDYSDSDTASITVTSPVVVKSLTGTGIVNANNANNEAVIGETIQYQVVVTLPEGTTNLAEIVDTMDAGLSFVSLDSITTSAGVTSSTVDLNDASTITPSISGQNVTFALGNIVNNNDSNASAETITLTYSVRVDNVAGNQGENTGTMLNNSALFGWRENGNDKTTSSSSAAEVEVIEPDLDIDKSVSSNNVDGSDRVVYTIVIDHNAISDTDAFDVTFFDQLPTELNINFATDVTITHSTAGDIKGLFELVAGNALRTNGSTFDLLLGETVTIVVDAQIDPTVVGGQVISNTASTSWTSIDGSDPNERDGSGGESNYTESSTATTTVESAALAKELVSTSVNNSSNANDEATIGELVTYRITVGVPEGRLPGAQIIDNLDLGLEFVSLDSVEVFSGATPTALVTSSVDSFSNTASFNPAVTGNGTTTAQTLEFDLGTIQNNNSNSTGETMVVTYTARVVNIAANTSNGSSTGTLLNNTAEFGWDGVSGRLTTGPGSADSVEIVEAELAISKAVNLANGDAGDAIQYTLNISHTGNSDTDAHDVTFSDAIPADINVSFASGVTVSHSTLGDISGLFELTATNELRTIAGSSFDLALGDTVSITIIGTLDVAVEPNQVLTNEACIDWSSLDGNVAGERTGADGAGGALNNYADCSNQVTTTINAPTLDKQLVSTSVDNNTDVVIGETLVYRVTIDLPEGTTPDALVLDDMDLGLQFISLDSIQVLSGGSTTADVVSTIGAFNTTNFAPAITGDGTATAQQLSFDFGTLTNSANNAATEQIVLTYSVRIANVASNTSGGSSTGTQLNNAALFQYTSGGATLQTAVDNTAAVEVTEPELEITKTVNDDTPHLGQTLTYTLQISHTSASDATARDIRLTDLVPSGMTLNIGSISVSGATIDANNSSGNAIDLVLEELAVGDSITLTYQATVDNDVSNIGDNVDNTVELTWTSLPNGDTSGGGHQRDGDAGNGGEDDYDDAATETAVITHPLVELTKTLSGTPSPAASGTANNYDVTYEFTITSTGNDPLTQMSLIEDLRAQYGSAFVGLIGSPSISSHTATDVPELNSSYDGGITDNELFDNSGGNTNLLAQNETVTIRISFEVDPDAVGAIINNGALVNQATVSGTGQGTGLVASDESDDPNDVTDTDPDGDNNPDDPNRLRFADIALTKEIVSGPSPASSGTAGNVDITFEFVIENVGSASLDSLTLTEDLSARFGGAFVGLVGSPTISASTAIDDPGINVAYDGTSSNSNIFDSSASFLNANETITVRLTIEFDPDSSTAVFDAVTGDSSGDFENQATVTGRDTVNGTTVNDNSDDLNDATDTDDDSDNDPDDPTAFIFPDITLDKQQVGSIVPATSGTDGNFQIIYDFTVTNTGGEALHSLSLVEDLQAQYGGAFVGLVSSPTIVASDATDNIELNAAYDGTTANSQLIDNSGGNTNLLEQGQSITVRLVIELDPDSPTANLVGGALVNQATTSGTGDVSGTNATDLSDDPNETTNTDPDGDNNPDDPNVVRIPLIALEKTIVGSPVHASSGTQGNWDVTYRFTIENNGTTPLRSLTLIEDLQTQFGGALVGLVGSPTIVSSTATDDPGINGSYDGTSANSNIFDGSASLLDVNQTITVQLVVEVDPDNATANYDAVTGDGNNDLENQASITGQDPASGTTVADNSDDPTDATDTDDDSDNDPDDPTTMMFTEIELLKTLIGTPVAASSGVSGNVDVTYDFAITNIGNEALHSLSLVEDLQAQYGGAFVGLVGSPTIVASDATDNIELNAAYDGTTTNSELIDNSGANSNLLDIGQSITVRLVIEVDTDAPTANLIGGGLFNQATVNGTGQQSSSTVTDDSDDQTDSTNTDTDGNNNPDDPNQIRVSTISLTKDIVSSPPAASGVFGNYDLTFQFTVTNTGTTDLENLVLTDDWANQFGGAFIGVIPGSLSVTNVNATTVPGANGTYSGLASQNMLDGSGLLQSGESFNVQITVEVDPNAPGANLQSGVLENQAVITGTDPTDPSVTASDRSDDTSDSTDSDPDGDNNPDDPTRFQTSEIGLAKKIIRTVPSTTTPGVFIGTYQFVLKNTGSMTLTNLTLADDLQTLLGPAYGGIASPATIMSSTATTDPNLNGGFDGNFGGIGDSQLFDGTSGELRAGEQITIHVQILVEVNQLVPTSQNQATASGFDGTATVTDLSDTGSDPESTNPGETGDSGGEDDPTLPPGIGIAKEHAAPVRTGDNWTVPVTFVVENLGLTDLVNLNLIEDIASEFGPAFVSADMPVLDASGVVGGTAPGINSAWSSDTRQNMLDGTGLLQPGDSFVITFNVLVDPDASGTSMALDNQGSIRANDPSNPALEVLDTSDSGSDPSGNNSGEPGDSGSTEDPTPLQIPDVAVVKSLVDSEQNGANFDLTYELVIENIGTVDLIDLTLTDDLIGQFAPHAVIDALAPTIVSSSATTDPNVNANWPADVATNMFDGSSGRLRPGESLTIRITVTVQPDYENLTGGRLVLANQAVTTGQGVDDNGNPIFDNSGDPLPAATDDSDSGSDANGTNPGEPGDAGTSDDPTYTEIDVFAFDSFNNILEPRDLSRNPIDNVHPAFPIDTLYTGITEPGTTLKLKVYDEDGFEIGERVVVADTAGNWLATFPGTIVDKQPHSMEVTQTPPIYQGFEDTGFNLRRYFHPAVHHSLFFYEPLTIQNVMRSQPHTVLSNLHEANQNPMGFGWTAHAYEQVSASTNASWQ